MLHLCNYKWFKSICKGGVFYLAIEVASALSLSPLPVSPPPPNLCVRWGSQDEGILVFMDTVKT